MLIFIYLLIMFTVYLFNLNLNEFIIDFLILLHLILFIACIYYIYKAIKSMNCKFCFYIFSLYYSIYISTGIFNAFNFVEPYPLILSLANHYPEVIDTFQDTFHDMGYASITDEMGIIMFNHYLFQHLDNEPLLFLPHLISLPREEVIATFADNHNLLQDCILEYKLQKRGAVADSHNLLTSIVNSVVERAMSELNINLLERHNVNQ